MVWLLLLLAIALEVVGTTALKLSAGLSTFVWTALALAAYSGAFAALAFTLKTLPVGLAYGIWAGLGTVGAVVVGVVVFREALGVVQIIGIVLVVAGIVLLKLYGTHGT